MASKKRTKNQLEYDRLRANYKRNLARAKKLGYEFPDMPDIAEPVRITRKALSEMRKLASGGFYKYATVIDRTTGEVISEGLEDKKLRLKINRANAAAKSAAQAMPGFAPEMSARDIAEKLLRGESLTVDELMFLARNSTEVPEGGGAGEEPEEQEAPAPQASQAPKYSEETAPTEEEERRFKDEHPELYEPKPPEKIEELRQIAAGDIPIAPAGHSAHAGLEEYIISELSRIPDYKYYRKGYMVDYSEQRNQLVLDFEDELNAHDESGTYGEYLSYLESQLAVIAYIVDGMEHSSGDEATDAGCLVQLMEVVKGSGLALEDNQFYTEMGEFAEGWDNGS